MRGLFCAVVKILMRFRRKMENGDKEAGSEGFRMLAQTYPNDKVLNMDRAAVYLEAGNTEEAEAIARRVEEGQEMMDISHLD